MTKTLVVPSIDPEFLAACPLQSEDEKRLLKEALKSEGCRDPIDVWEGANLILDGHTRFAMCKELGIPYTVRYVTLPDRAACLRWIRIHQLGRRNLTDAQRSILRGHLYNETKQSHGGDRGQVEKISTCSTAEEIAENERVTGRTIRNDAAFAENVEEVIEKVPELREPIEHGVIPKSAVEALADAPKSKLKKLAKLEGKELRKAAKECAKDEKKEPPKSGEQKKDPRLWKRLEEQIGKAKPMVDDLHRQHPHGVLHRTLQSQLSQCMASLSGWKKAALKDER